jgi:hypothetical protein
LHSSFSLSRFSRFLHLAFSIYNLAFPLTGSCHFLTGHLTGPTAKKPLFYKGPYGLTGPDPQKDEYGK